MALARHGPAAAALAWGLLLARAAPVEGGLTTGSRTRHAANEARRLAGSLNRLSGLEYLFSGYDIFFGNPKPTSGDVDTGFRGRVFKEAHARSNSLPDGTSVPDGVSALMCESSCSLLSTTKSIKSLQDYYNFLSMSVYVDIGFGDIAKFSASADYNRVREDFETHDSVYTTVTAYCCAYEAFLHTFEPPPFDDNFLAAVHAAPDDYDQDFYFGLIGNFGTHVLSSAQMGSMYGEESHFTEDQYNIMTAANRNWSLMAQASFMVSVNMSIANGADMSSAKSFEKFSTVTLKYSLGATPAKWDPEDWLSATLQRQPVPTSFKLNPLSEVFTVLNFPNQSNATKLEATRRNVERALKEYCPEKLLREGKVHSCTKVMTEADTTADDKTCLVKVWGGGGPNGLPFDDSAQMVELNGLFSSLQVSQITYRSHRWVDSIQLELGLGGTRWPLPEHGGKGGATGTLTFSESQRIVAVDLRYERYIDAVHFWTDDGMEHIVGGPGGSYSRTVDFKQAVWNATGHLPESAWLVGLYGHSERYVDSLGFYVAYTCSPSALPGPAGLARTPGRLAGGVAAAGPPRAPSPSALRLADVR